MLRSRSRKVLFAATLTAVALAVAAAATDLTASGQVIGITSRQSFTCLAKGSDATTNVRVAGVSTDGSRDDYAAIQGAINAAGRRGGGVVALPAGTFMINGHLILRNNVTLTGAGPATVIKAGPEFLSSQGPGGGYPVISTAGASDTTIANLTVDQSGNSLNGNVAGRLNSYVVEGRNSSNVVVDGVYIRQPFTYSIAMVGTTDFCVENSNILVTTSKRYNQLDGIHILDSSDGEVINNTVESGDDALVAHTIGAPVHNILYANNIVYGGRTDAGMQIAVGDFPVYDIKVEDNDFYGSLFGIHVRYYGGGSGALYDVTISRNYLYDLPTGSRSPGIYIENSGGARISNVAVTQNRMCRAGIIIVRPGSGDVVNGTTGC